MKTDVTIAIVGAGSRGTVYAEQAQIAFDGKCRVVAVAEPRDFQRKALADHCNIDKENQYSDWRELASQPKLADAVVIATHDQMHTEPALAFLEKGYHILLEKPMAPTEEECRAIVATANRLNRIVAVSHVLRYTPYFRKLRELVQSGAIGEPATFRHFEGVVYWHQAHSYVRGNWRNTKESSPMILAKSCHDLDIMLFILGLNCKRLSSFGSLKHFRSENQPEGATSRCLDCPLADSCIYSAKTYYLSHLHKGDFQWPLDVITSDFSEEGVMEALRNGPYGRCVYACDNDVVDHQTINMLFDRDVTGTFTMTAFSEDSRGRETEIMGTHGTIWGDTSIIRLNRFNGETTEFNMDDTDGMLSGGHLGGDAGLMHDFVAALLAEDPSLLSSSPDTSLESHLMAFAAEKSRLDDGRTVSIHL